MNTNPKATLPVDAEAQWRLRRESLGLLLTVAAPAPSAELLADMRIAAARERRLAREAGK